MAPVGVGVAHRVRRRDRDLIAAWFSEGVGEQGLLPRKLPVVDVPGVDRARSGAGAELDD